MVGMSRCGCVLFAASCGLAAASTPGAILLRPSESILYWIPRPPHQMTDQVTTLSMWRTVACLCPATLESWLLPPRRIGQSSRQAPTSVSCSLCGHEKPSVVLLRSADHLTPAGQAELLVANLPAVIDELLCGAIVTFARGRACVRLLPVVEKRPPDGLP
jgi:hypothetical protein